MKKKVSVHYYSDCSFFAGCESMLANFFNSDDFRKYYDLSFTYVDSDLYKRGFQQRVKKEVTSYPINSLIFFNYSNVSKALPKPLLSFVRCFLYIPFFLCQIFILYRLFKRIAPDILHINNGGYPAARSALSAAIAAKIAGVPKVLMVVNNMARGYTSLSRWIDFPIDRLVVRCVDIFVTGSNAASQVVRGVLSLPQNQVVAIHNGIELRQSTSTICDTRKRLGLDGFNGVVFGVVALLVPRKGHAILLEAILDLVTERKLAGHEFKVLIEGDGPLKSELINFIFINNLSQFVTFVGNESNIVDFMSAIDILILPSVQDEDFPNVVLEAMSLGKPVIVSRLAGTPEQVLDGKTGLLVDPRNVSQLASAISQVVKNNNMRDSMARAALERFNSNFTSQISLKNYSNLYAKLINFKD